MPGATSDSGATADAPQRFGVVFLGAAGICCVVAVLLLVLHHSTNSTTPAITALSSLGAAAIGGIAGMLSPVRNPSSLSPSAIAQPTASIDLAPNQGPARGAFRVDGSGFTPSEAVTIQFDTAALAAATADAAGGFSQNEAVPASAASGSHVVIAIGAQSARVANAQYTVG